MNKLETVYNPKMETTALENIKSKYSNFMYSLQTFSTVVSKLQGWKTFGLLEEFWIKPVHERANLESARVHDFKLNLEKMWGEYSKKELKSMANDLIHYDELGATTTKMKLIAMALNLGNEGNSSKLFSTRPVGVESTKPWNKQVVMDLLSNNLTKKDWQTVNKTWELINTLWPDLSSFHKEMTGFEPKKVEAAPFEVTLKNGEVIQMNGGYYPLKQDPRASLIAAARETEQGALYTEQNPSWKATTKTGHTKSRSNANYSISLDISLMNTHILDVIHDLYFRDIVADYRRVLNNKNFQETVRNKLGPEGLKSFQDQVANIANGESYKNVAMSGVEGIVDYLRKAGTKAAITFRVGVITQNAANVMLYPKSIDGFGIADTTTGIIKHGLMNYLPKAAFNWKAAREMREQIYELSPYMRDRRKSPDYTLNDIQSNMFSDKGKISEFGLGLLSASDDLTAIPMWKTAYEKKMADTNDSKQSAYYADSLIRSVNGSGRKYDVSPIIRSKKTTDKVMTAFYGFMNTEFNRWVKEAGIAVQTIDNAPRFLGFVASRMIGFVIASDLLAGKGPQEKDDPVAYYGAKIISYPLQLIPIARDVAPMIIDNSLGLNSFGYRPPIAFSSFDAIEKLASKSKAYVKKLDTGKGKIEGQDVVEASAKVASYLTGYPDQFNAWFFNAYDYWANGMDPDLKDMMKRRPNKKRDE